jgi:hypothetical protein
MVGIWFQPEFVNSLGLPPEADSLGIPISGAVFLSFQLVFINLVIHFLMLIFSIDLIVRKAELINIFSISNDKTITKIIKLIIFTIVISIILTTTNYYNSNLLLLISFIQRIFLFAALYFFVITVREFFFGIKIRVFSDN